MKLEEIKDSKEVQLLNILANHLESRGLKCSSFIKGNSWNFTIKQGKKLVIKIVANSSSDNIDIDSKLTNAEAHIKLTNETATLLVDAFNSLTKESEEQELKA